MYPHHIPGTSPTLLKPSSWTGALPFNNLLRESIINNDLVELARLMKVHNPNPNTPMRVTYLSGVRGDTPRWRTPLEYAIERCGLSDPEMVVFLLEKGARITTPAMVLALYEVNETLYAGGGLPTNQGAMLIKILSAAGARWDQVGTGENKLADEGRRLMRNVTEHASAGYLQEIGLPMPGKPKFTEPEEFLARMAEKYMEEKTAQVEVETEAEAVRPASRL